MIRGVTIELCGRSFTVPALTIDQLETFEQDIATASSRIVDDAEAFAKDRLMAMSRVIHAALSRNYPEIAYEDLKKLLDLDNIGRAFAATMGISGLEEKDAPSGEAPAGAQTGTSSAPASAPSPAGAGPTPAS